MTRNWNTILHGKSSILLFILLSLVVLLLPMDVNKLVNHGQGSMEKGAGEVAVFSAKRWDRRNS